jgi:HEAT repeat protein
MKRFLIVGALLSLLAAPTNAQCPNLVSYVKDLLGDDRELQKRAGQNELCQLALFAQDKPFFDREVLPRVEELLKSEEPLVRAGASAVAAAMTAYRHDSGEVLSSFLPLMIKYLDDPETKVRQNAAIIVMKVVGQTESPPGDVLEALVRAAKSGADNVRDRSFTALVQVRPMPESISEFLLAETEGDDEPIGKATKLRALGLARDLRPEIVSTLITSLRSDDKEVVRASISAIAQLGPRAAAASSELRRLAQESKDEMIAKGAFKLAERLESPNQQ